MKPAFRIVIDGTQDVTGTVASRLLSLEISDRAGVQSDRLTLEIDDRDGRIAIPRTGAKVAAFIGYQGRELQRMGEFVVDEVQLSGPERSMTILANAADMTGTIKAAKERSFAGKTFGSIIRTLAAESRLKASIPDDLDRKLIEHADQTESNMQFATRLAANLGATAKVADGRLVIAKRAAGETASGRRLPEVAIAARDCEGWSCVLSERGKYGQVAAAYHDKAKAKRVEVTAGEGTPRMVLKQSFATEAEARDAARSKLQTLSRGTRKLTINGLIGDTRIQAEALAALSGFRAGIDGGGWVIDEVTHRVDDVGYTCTVRLESQV